MNAREALADALAKELGIEVPKGHRLKALMQATDKVLIRLYIHGFIVTEVKEDKDVAA